VNRGLARGKAKIGRRIDEEAHWGANWFTMGVEDGRLVTVDDASTEKGVFTLPLRDELIKENPRVLANQPKGTIRLEARMDLAIDLQWKVNNRLLRK
jgi:hypothetical protein